MHVQHNTELKQSRIVRWMVAGVAATAWVSVPSSRVLAQTQPGAQQMYDYYSPDDPYVDTMMRGPVHEAFAEPISFDPEPGPLAPAAPPTPIDEIPPDYRPDGANVSWIPGYWTWDDDVNDYIWISGIWRSIPPGREWISGYWIRSDGGYRWIPGYWGQIGVSQSVYLPEPPQSVESGPNYAVAPSPDDIWVSGTWVWNSGRYAWRPGYWLPGRQDWIWIPAHYVWSPRGYVFVDGYWDYDVDRRGILFAPVRFEQPVYRRPRFRYTPQIVIDLRTLTDHLFVRPRHYHYYFGDYFDQRYVNRGYRPWFSLGTSRRVYDPIYVHQRWRHRNDREWDSRLRRDFDHRRQNVGARPARSWREQRQYSRRRDRDQSPGDRLRNLVGKSLSTVMRRKHDSFNFTQLDEQRRKELAERRNGIQRVRDQRREAESRTDGRPDRRYRTRTKPAHTPGIKSPISSKPERQLGEGQRPPQQPDRPNVDKKVEPRRRPAVKRNTKEVRKEEDGKREHDRNREPQRRDRKSSRDKDH